MQKIILSIIFSLLFVSPCLATQKVYYSKTLNKTVVDVSGVKSVDLINLEFFSGIEDVQEVTIDEKTEGYRLVDGVLEKYTIPLPEPPPSPPVVKDATGSSDTVKQLNELLSVLREKNIISGE